MPRYKRSYGLRRKSRRTSNPGKYARLLLTKGNNALGQLGDYSLAAEDRFKMFGPSFRQRLLEPAKYPHGPTARQIIARRGFNYRGDGDYGATGNQYGLFNFGSGASMSNRLSGMGDYGPTEANSIMEGSSAQTPMTVNAASDLSNDIFFANREFVGNVYATRTGTAGTTGPSQFLNTTYALNAGLATTFPWLSQVANNFTLYRMEGLIFEYRPTSGEFSGGGNASLGKVVMATQYDPDAPAFTSSNLMENYAYAMATKPSIRLLSGVETKAGTGATNMLYTRNGSSVKSKIFTDIGNFQIATEGVPLTIPAAATQVTAVVGELWVSYRTKLARAQIFDNLIYGGNAISDLWSSSNNQIGTLMWGPSPTSVFRTAATNSGLWTITSGGTNTIKCTLDKSINSGSWRIQCFYTTPNVADAASSLDVGTLTNCTFTQQPIGPITTLDDVYDVSRAANNSTRMMCMAYISIQQAFGENASFTFSFSGAGSAGAYVKILITEFSTLDLPSVPII